MTAPKSVTANAVLQPPSRQSIPSSPQCISPSPIIPQTDYNHPQLSNNNPTPPHQPKHPANSSGHRTHRALLRSRKNDAVSTSIAINNLYSRPNNIHREELPQYVPQDIADNVELCYMKREQCGWVPLLNVDPGYDYQKDHASYDMWWETSEAGVTHNPKGVEAYRNSPRLVNFRKRHGETGILPLGEDKRLNGAKR